MADLIAQGAEPLHRWRRELPAGRTCILGRDAGVWSAPWDDRISRRHAQLCWREDRLEVAKLAESRNPIFFCGRRADRFEAAPGEHFVIGSTTFTVADERATVSLDAPRPLAEQKFSSRELQEIPFRDAEKQIDLMSRLLEIVSGAASDDELLVRLVNLLLTGVPRASAVALVAAGRGDPSRAPIEVLHWDRRTLSREDFRPSQRLIRQALAEGQSVLHVWAAGESGGDLFTQNEDLDWAFCTPAPSVACRGWAIYLAGRSPRQEDSCDFGPETLHDELKLAELAASTLSRLRDLRALQRRQAGLSRFFSPVVLDALGDRDPDEVLAPRQAQVSVLFCDLRGFSRSSERSAGDLLGLLRRVSRALGLVTRHILRQGGVVGDFHGDAAMGFWGWPLPQPDAAQRACQAALDIRAEFEQAGRQGQQPLTDFRLGIGIATGRAVAGEIGTDDQVKVTVFGPVVNLASRLEELTKELRAPILLDEPTARTLRATSPPAGGRVRRVARILPHGLETPLEVSQLLPPASEYPQLSDQDLMVYEAAVDALLGGDWEKAFQLLHQVPADDRVKDFLTVFIAQHNRTPPSDWDGVIPLPPG